ncbi:MAG: hypothetical protein H0W86_00590 [Armatimonadetes bacterium]|nr:hypothetical protein [Armatimonadota bacterium]
MVDWYPVRDSELTPWHFTLHAECVNYAATFPMILDIAALAKVAANKDIVAILVNKSEQARNFFFDVTEYKDIWLDSDLGTPTPPVPVPPSAIVPSAGAMVGVEAFTRQLVAQLKAHPNMTPAIEAAMGIRGTADTFGDPEIISAIPRGASQVRLRLKKAGYPACAVDSRRPGGAWDEIGISLTAGVSEVREYRIQGVLDNVRQGSISAVVQVATTP